MSGKPQFDEATVIAAAIEVFWRHGYAAAAISDLTEATGLSRSSLYQRFRDKDGLFQEALATYTQRVLRRMNSADADTARGRMKALLRAFLPDGSGRPAGCLIGRSCAEISSLSGEGQAAALAGATRQREIFEGLLREGVAAGELAEDVDIDAMAWHYLGVLQAVLNSPQAGADPRMLDRMIDVAMAVWPSAPQKGSMSKNQRKRAASTVRGAGAGKER
ncbi:TetR/AcrR family transcriptional regulator [Dyella humicola]|uniref:TetR/AcrR family transcriptional regulator n=1 Tax=Dyella humicola TaxID=2992126 RepID=UPI00224F024E|nr:TetR/AcrR family transcriptional regulator [Dyella humicola]